MNMTTIVRFFAALALVLVLASLDADPARAELSIDIHGPGQTRLHLAMAEPMGPDANATVPDQAARLDGLLLENFTILPFFRMIPDNTILGGTALEGFQTPDVDFKRFQFAEADLLLTQGWLPAPDAAAPTVELRVYEVFTGRLVIGKSYPEATPDKMVLVADQFSAGLMETLTGDGSFFRSTMAFTRRLPGQEEKAIWTCSPLGRDLQRITSMGGFALSPTWSNDGRYIVFSHVGERYHSLGLWDRKTGKVSSKRYPGNTVIGPTFTPENKVAVSMASGGNPDIFLLSHTFEKEELLVDNWAIDVSPDMDAMGRRMAFVSSRLGNPHIFVLDTASGETRRVTFEGKYNTHPSMSPDGTLVVFSRMTDMGHRIFLHDLETGMERQLTFGPGNDEEPTFAPDGYFVAFSSDRAGRKQLYLTTRHGDAPRLIPTGEGAANFPAWGPDPAKQ